MLVAIGVETLRTSFLVLPVFGKLNRRMKTFNIGLFTMKKKIVLRIAAKGIFGMSGCPKISEGTCGIMYRAS